ncbi:hypothetical protein ADL19_32960 [Streptomyces purpurogeneiscleroticus]|nr:hypothetical protein ADL19_32960 [Streptomyces purpurogeneiscleroticus]
MRIIPDRRSTMPTFDPFGEPVADGVARASSAGDRMALRIGGAVFWTLALAILAGRIYAFDMPAVQSVATYATQVVALR